MVHLGVFSKLHTKNDANETGIRIFNSYFETKTEANVNPHTSDYFIFLYIFSKGGFHIYQNWQHHQRRFSKKNIYMSWKL